MTLQRPHAGVMITLLSTLTGVYAKRAVTVRLQQQEKSAGDLELGSTADHERNRDREREMEQESLVPYAAGASQRQSICSPRATEELRLRDEL